MGISQSLPKTGYIKMIDIWMIFTMSYPFLVIFLYSCLEVTLYLFISVKLYIARTFQFSLIVQILKKKKESTKKFYGNTGKRKIAKK